MITDVDLQFSDDQAIVADADSTNVIDMGTEGKQFEDATFKPYCFVGTTFDNLTSLRVSLVSDSTSTITPDKVIWQSGEILLADLTAGAEISLPSLNNLI